eukprot:tig00000254_g22526.t1
MQLSLELPPLLAGRYRLYEKLGMGSFGDVFSGADVYSGTPVAVKLEHVQCPRPALWHEAAVLADLARSGGAFPRVHFAGCVGDLNALVMDRLGRCLSELHDERPDLFDAQAVLAIGVQLINELERMHELGWLHRDIKARNLLLDPATSSRVFLIDMGLAKAYWVDGTPGTHVPDPGPRPGKPPTGTPKYMSVNVHEGAAPNLSFQISLRRLRLLILEFIRECPSSSTEPSRRDDLESAFYCLANFARHTVPWADVNEATRERYNEVTLERKRGADPGALFAGCPAAPELADCLRAVRAGVGLELRGFNDLPPKVPAPAPAPAHPAGPGPPEQGQGLAPPPPGVGFALLRLYLPPGAADPAYPPPTFTEGIPRPPAPPEGAAPASEPPSTPSEEAGPIPPEVQLRPRPVLETGGSAAAAQVTVALYAPERLVDPADFGLAAARIWGAVVPPSRPPPRGPLLYRNPASGSWAPLAPGTALPYVPQHVYEFAYSLEEPEEAAGRPDPSDLGSLTEF